MEDPIGHEFISTYRKDGPLTASELFTKRVKFIEDTMRKHEKNRPISMLNKKFTLATNEFNKAHELHYGCLSEENDSKEENEESEDSP